jgi:hypothetical protein
VQWRASCIAHASVWRETTDMRVFTLRVEEGRNGLVCITSPEIKGLFVAEQTLADALMAASDLVPALEPEPEPAAGKPAGDGAARAP